MRLFPRYEVGIPDFQSAPLHSASSLRWVFYFLAPHWKLFSFLSLNRTGRMVFFAGIQPLILAKIVAVLESGRAFQDPSPIWHWLWLLVGLASIVFLLLLVCAEEAKLCDRVGRGARLLALSHLSRLSIKWHEGSASGGKLQKIMMGSQGLTRLLRTYFSSILTLFAGILGTIVAILGMGLPSFYLFFMAGFAALYLAFAWWSGSWVARGFDKSNELLEILVGKVYEFVDATSMVKSFNLEKHILDKARRGEQEGYEQASHVHMIDYTRWIGLNFIGLGWVVLIVAFAAKQVLHNEIPVAAFVLATYQASRFWGIMEEFNDIYDRILEDNSGFKRLVGLLRQEPSAGRKKSVPTLAVPKGAIRFNNVQFAYNSRATVFNGLTLHIKSGEKVGIVGPSGAGKSSLVKLLLRFYDPNQNEITIDDQNISAVCPHSVRQQMAVIPQEVNLFNHSVMDNIRYGRLDATDEEVRIAARKADAEEFILKLPQGYETPIGERGLRLSGGQRQRIAIARAILRDAPILILDEATSALDAATEKAIQEGLKDLMKHKTVIAIAHRLSTLLNMDRLIVLEKGKIVEEGSHDELLRRNGFYAKLWALQSSGFIRDRNVSP